MAFEISEITVRLAVSDPGGSHAAAGDGHHAARPCELTPAQREEIVKECVRAVLQTLRLLEAR